MFCDVLLLLGRTEHAVTPHPRAQSLRVFIVIGFLATRKIVAASRCSFMTMSCTCIVYISRLFTIVLIKLLLLLLLDYLVLVVMCIYQSIECTNAC
jgi:hypothetical protein